VIDPVEDSSAAATPTKTSAKETPESSQATSTAAAEEKKLEKKLEKQPVEKQWNLLGPYMGQYIVYTGPNSAWLLSYVHNTCFVLHQLCIQVSLSNLLFQKYC
jgi:hypothetical protein